MLGVGGERGVGVRRGEGGWGWKRKEEVEDCGFLFSGLDFSSC